MGETYELVKYLWQHLDVKDVHKLALGFDGASNRDFLLPKLVELPGLPKSVLELGPMYNLWSTFIVGIMEINRVHLSDPMYMTRGVPSPEIVGINPDLLTFDSYGLPELLDELPILKLGETTLVLANVINYVDGQDLARLLERIGETYHPRVVVIGNNFTATLGHGHINRIKTPGDIRELLTSKNFQAVVEEFDDEYLAGIYKL